MSQYCERWITTSSSIKLGLLSLVLFVGFVGTASADSVYTYTGNAFNFFNGYACPPECNISGSFTLDNPLAANLNLTAVSPGSFSFADGTNTWASTNTLVLSDILVSTNSSGSIIGWVLGIYNFGSAGIPVLLTENNGNLACGAGCTAMDESFFGAGNPAYAAVINNPGAWSVVGTPEPASLFLLSTGLLSAFWMKRRRQARLG